jgi:hypothetical protein
LLRSRQSWTRWRQSRATRRLAKQLARTQALLGLLAEREARLQVELQLQGLTQEARLLRVSELLADLSTPEQPETPPEPLSPVQMVPSSETELLLPQMHRPEELTLEPMPPAEDQLALLLGPPSTLQSHPSSES